MIITITTTTITIIDIKKYLYIITASVNREFSADGSCQLRPSTLYLDGVAVLVDQPLMKIYYTNIRICNFNKYTHLKKEERRKLKEIPLEPTSPYSYNSYNNTNLVP